jgi:hypothetical protein
MSILKQNTLLRAFLPSGVIKKSLEEIVESLMKSDFLERLILPIPKRLDAGSLRGFARNRSERRRGGVIRKQRAKSRFRAECSEGDRGKNKRPADARNPPFHLGDVA